MPSYPCRWPLNLICPNCLPCSSSFAHFQPFHPSCHIAHYHLALSEVVRSDFWRFKFWRITWLWLGMGSWCCQARPPRLQKRRPEGRDVPASFPQSIIKSELGPAPYGLMALAGGAAEYNTASSSSHPPPLHTSSPLTKSYKWMWIRWMQYSESERKFSLLGEDSIVIVPGFYCQSFWNPCAL